MTNRLAKFASQSLHSFGFAFLALALLAAPEASSPAGRAVAAAAQPADTVVASCPCNAGNNTCGSASYNGQTKEYSCPDNGGCGVDDTCSLKVMTPTL